MPTVAPIDPIIDVKTVGNLIKEITAKDNGKWVRRLFALATVLDNLHKDDFPNENDPVLKAAEDALIRHLEKLQS